MKLRLRSRVTLSIFSLDDIGRLRPSSDFSKEIVFSKKNRSANKHYLTFRGIQHEMIVGKPRIKVSNTFENFSETGSRIKIRGTDKESDIIRKLLISNFCMILLMGKVYREKGMGLRTEHWRTPKRREREVKEELPILTNCLRSER